MARDGGAQARSGRQGSTRSNSVSAVIARRSRRQRRMLVLCVHLGGAAVSNSRGSDLAGIGAEILILPFGGDLSMSGSAEGKRAELGVLFVAGIGSRRRGAVAALGAALFVWLFRWNRSVDLSGQDTPVLTNTVLSVDAGGADEPAHLSMTAPLPLSTGRRQARWLLAESSWTAAHASPRFLDLGRWIWKVSTCLLVLQFVIPMRRHWRQSGKSVTSSRSHQGASTNRFRPAATAPSG
jgi:hypothetical protein